MQALRERFGKSDSAENHRKVSDEIRGQLFSEKRTGAHLQTMAGPVESLSLRKVQVKLQSMGQSASDRN